MPYPSKTARRLPPRRLTILAGVLLAMGVATAAQNWAPWDFDRIVRSADARYGLSGGARERVNAWSGLLQSPGSDSQRQQLERVNRFFNQQITFSDDQRVWRQVDYWATPVESLSRGAGDCEDYAIAKYFSLRRLGVPSERLRITYVKALRLNQAHMVLTYYESQGADPLVLDNLVNDIRPASQRSDLLPVYAFNAEGLYLAGKSGSAGDPKRLSRWQDLLGKMRAEGFAIGEG